MQSIDKGAEFYDAQHRKLQINYLKGKAAVWDSKSSKLRQFSFWRGSACDLTQRWTSFGSLQVRDARYGSGRPWQIFLPIEQLLDAPPEPVDCTKLQLQH